MDVLQQTKTLFCLATHVHIKLETKETKLNWLLSTFRLIRWLEARGSEPGWGSRKKHQNTRILLLFFVVPRWIFLYFCRSYCVMRGTKSLKTYLNAMLLVLLLMLHYSVYHTHFPGVLFWSSSNDRLLRWWLMLLYLIFFDCYGYYWCRLFLVIFVCCFNVDLIVIMTADLSFHLPVFRGVAQTNSALRYGGIPFRDLVSFRLSCN